MPIDSRVRHFYRREWHQLSREIRQERAKNRCECRGECGAHGDRCSAEHGEKHPVTGGEVVLTVAHLDQDPREHDPARLRAMCQRCHITYDRQPEQTARRHAIYLEIAGQQRLQLGDAAPFRAYLGPLRTGHSDDRQRGHTDDAQNGA